MPEVGLTYLVGATLTETSGAPVYTLGKEIAQAIKADIAPELIDIQLYANNGISESINQFKKAKVTINANDLTADIKAWILGNTPSTLGTGETLLTANAGDDAPFIGFGFYGKVIRTGVDYWKAIWIHKIKFNIPNESHETQGENIAFQTPTIEGTAYPDILGTWKEEVVFATEQAAIDWLETKCAITDRVLPVTSDVASGFYEATKTVTLTCATQSATIKYSLDYGETFTTYTTPLEVTGTSIIICYATKSLMRDSVETKFDLVLDVA